MPFVIDLSRQGTAPDGGPPRRNPYYRPLRFKNNPNGGGTASMWF